MIVTDASAAAFVGRMRAARDASEHTARAYASDLRDYRAFLAAHSLCPREQGTILAYAAHLGSERRAAPRTVRRRMACLRGFYKDLVRCGAIDRSPFTGLEMQLPRTRSLPRSLTRAEARLLAGAASRAADTAPTCDAAAAPASVLLLLAAGLRVGELVRLRPQDWDAEDGGLHVRGKGRRERRVFIVDDQLRAMVSRLAGRSGATALFAPDGAAWSAPAVRRELRILAARAGIERRITPHMLRHTCATLLLEGGVDIRFLQRLLGHESISTTAIYAHVTDTGLRRALANAGLLAALVAR